MGGMSPLKAMDRPIDLSKFMGSWYVIAHIPVFTEKNAYNAVENYEWDEKNQRFQVTYRFNEAKNDGPLDVSYQRGFINNKQTCTDLKVTPKLPLVGYTPLRLSYLITHMADDYSDIIVGFPNRKYLWIMARTPSLPVERYDSLVQMAVNQGYDSSLIRKVPQDASAPAFLVPTQPIKIAP
mmetsp:Transcript_8013/g.22033  ORF Transcript_8013/g.22033 Transcript_8013/m.22033 type:complete len:181 (+) Transcript_8013:71-613(+)